MNTTTQTMTPEAQRIAIAEACGWKRIGTEKNLPLYGWVEVGPCEEIPDYPSDLNAMHRATKCLNAFQWELYREELAELCTPLAICSGKEQQYKFAMEATAPQRAEALLRAIGKWVE